MTQFRLLLKSLSHISHMHRILDRINVESYISTIELRNRTETKPQRETVTALLFCLAQAVVSGPRKRQGSFLEDIGRGKRRHILEGRHGRGRPGNDRDVVEEAEPKMLAYLDVPEFDLFEAQLPPSAVYGGLGGGAGCVLEFMCSPAHVDLIECSLFVIGEQKDEAVKLAAVIPREVCGFVRQDARPMPADRIRRGALGFEVGKVRLYWCMDQSGCSRQKWWWVWKEV